MFGNLCTLTYWISHSGISQYQLPVDKGKFIFSKNICLVTEIISSQLNNLGKLNVNMNRELRFLGFFTFKIFTRGTALIKNRTMKELWNV